MSERDATVARRLQWSVQIGLGGLLALAVDLIVTWLVSAETGLVAAMLTWPVAVIVVRRRNASGRRR